MPLASGQTTGTDGAVTGVQPHLLQELADTRPTPLPAVLSVVADHPASPAAYRARLAPIQALRHVTVEVHRCPGSSAH